MNHERSRKAGRIATAWLDGRAIAACREGLSEATPLEKEDHDWHHVVMPAPSPVGWCIPCGKHQHPGCHRSAVLEYFDDRRGVSLRSTLRYKLASLRDETCRILLDLERLKRWCGHDPAAIHSHPFASN